MASNIITLVCWTVIAPQHYVRQPYAGTEIWNRVISTHGSCTASTTAKGGSFPHLAILALANLSILVVANIQAYQARSINTEYSESRFIAIIMASML